MQRPRPAGDSDGGTDGPAAEKARTDLHHLTQAAPLQELHACGAAGAGQKGRIPSRSPSAGGRAALEATPLSEENRTRGSLERFVPAEAGRRSYSTSDPSTRMAAT
jgi:hypothetical protein